MAVAMSRGSQAHDKLIGELSKTCEQFRNDGLDTTEIAAVTAFLLGRLVAQCGPQHSTADIMSAVAMNMAMGNEAATDERGAGGVGGPAPLIVN